MSNLNNKEINFLIILMILLSIKSIPNKKDKPDIGIPDDIKDNLPPDLKDDNKIKTNIHNSKEFDKVDDLRKRHENIIKENINSKAKLKKYNLYFFIIEMLNIIFAIIIILYVISKLYQHYKLRRNRIILINNKISFVDELKNERSIYKQSIQIESQNNDLEDKEAPPVNFNQ